MGSAALFMGLAFAFPALAANAPAPRLDWIDEDGTDLPIDWRTSTSWVWQKNVFSLQVWIEAPRDLLLGPSSFVEPGPGLQVETGGPHSPFKLRPEHAFLIVQMRGPSQLIKFKPGADDARVRALRIEIPFKKTTWMKQSTCSSLSPYLVERYIREPGPFFVALRCLPEEKFSNPRESTAVVQVQASEDAVVLIQPSGSAYMKSPNTLAAPSPGVTRAQQLLANIEIKDQQGARSASFDLRRQAPLANAPAPLAPEENKGEDLELGLGANFLEAKNGSYRQNFFDGVGPALVASWTSSRAIPQKDMGIEGEVPLAVFGDPLKGPRTSMGWARGWVAAPKDSGSTSARGLIGAQATYMKARDLETGSPAWMSPVIGLQGGLARGADWTTLLVPFAFGAGDDAWSRVQVHLGGSMEAVKIASASIRLFAKGVALGSVGRGGESWSAAGLTVGAKGGF